MTLHTVPRNLLTSLTHPRLQDKANASLFACGSFGGHESQKRYDACQAGAVIGASSAEALTLPVISTVRSGPVWDSIQALVRP